MSAERLYVTIRRQNEQTSTGLEQGEVLKTRFGLYKDIPDVAGLTCLAVESCSKIPRRT